MENSGGWQNDQMQQGARNAPYAQQRQMMSGGIRDDVSMMHHLQHPQQRQEEQQFQTHHANQIHQLHQQHQQQPPQEHIYSQETYLNPQSHQTQDSQFLEQKTIYPYSEEAAEGASYSASQTFEGSTPSASHTSKPISSNVTQEQIDQVLGPFWQEMLMENQNLDAATTDFKIHSDLPLARIKRIIKADEDVRMVSGEAPVMFARACSMFIMELAKRAWLEAEDCKRRTIQKEDIHAAILKVDMYDFLVDVVDGTIEEEQRQIRPEQQQIPSHNSEVAEEFQPPQGYKLEPS